MEIGQPVGSKWLARARGRAVEPVDDPLRAGARSRSSGTCTHPHTSAGRVPDRRRLPPATWRARSLRESPCRAPASGSSSSSRSMRREVDEAMRADDRAPLPGDRPAGARLRAAAAHRHDPARRGAAAAAADRAGRRDHLDGRGHQARLHVRRAGRPGLADWAASYLNERLAGPGPRRATLRSGSSTPSCRARPSRRSSRQSRPPSPTSPTRSRTRSTSTAPPACSPRARVRRHPAGERPDPALERRVTLLARAALGAGRADGLPAHRRRRTRARAALGERGRPPTTGSATARSAPSSVIGPVRMDYRRAIRSVRGPPRELVARSSRTSTR